MSESRIRVPHEKLAAGVFRVGPFAQAILIESADKLPALTGLQPGSIAFTAGYAAVWQLDTDGTTWVQMVGGE